EEPPAGAGVQARQPHLGDQLVRPERRGEMRDEELARPDFAVARRRPGDDAALEAYEQRGELGGGIGVGEASGDRAARADRVVADIAERVGEEGEPLLRPHLEPALAHERADRDLAVLFADLTES